MFMGARNIPSDLLGRRAWFSLHPSRWVEWDEIIKIVNVYSPCVLIDKRTLWEELNLLKGRVSDGLWCVIGNFNSIRSQDKRLGRHASQHWNKEIHEFNNFIDNMGLFEIPWIRRKFTWVRVMSRSMSTRLDRALVSMD